MAGRKGYTDHVPHIRRYHYSFINQLIVNRLNPNNYTKTNIYINTYNHLL